MGTLSWAALAASVAVNGGVALTLLTIFSILRALPTTADFYVSRLKSNDVARKPPWIPSASAFNPASWLPTLLRIDDDTLGNTAGLDAVIVVRMLRLGIQLFLGLSFLSICIVLPANLSGNYADTFNGKVQECTADDNSAACGLDSVAKCIDWRTDNPDSDGQPPYTPGQDDIPQTCQSAPSCTRCFCVEWEASFQAQRGFSPWSPSYQGCDSDPTCATCREWRSFCSECDEIGDITLTDLDRTSLANVGDDDPLLWAHVAFMALATVLVLTLLSRYNSDTITLRLRYLATIAPGGQSTSVLVTDIPGTLAGTPLGQVLWMIDKGAWFIPGFLRRRVLEQVQAITLRLHEIAHVGLRALSDAPSLGGRRRLVLTGAANRGVEGAEGAEHPAKDESGGEGSGLRSYVSSLLRGHRNPGSDAGGPSDAASLRRDVNEPLLPQLPEVELLGDAWEEAETVMRQGLSFDDMVRREVEGCFGGGRLLETVLVRDVGALAKLYEEFVALREKAELTFDIYQHQILTRADSPDGKQSALKRRTTRVIPAASDSWGKEFVKTHGGGCRGAVVETLEYCKCRMEYLKEAVQREQVESEGRESPSALVVFRDRESAATAMQVFIHHDRKYWITHPAPAPGEILWGNLMKRQWETNLRQRLMLAGFVALLIFYLVPVTFVQGFLDTTRWVREDWPVLKNIENYPALEAILQGILPGLAMVLFLALLPPLLRAAERFGGAMSLGAVETVVVSKLFWFQAVAVFLFNLGVSSLAQSFDTLINEPSNFVQKLALNVPGTFSFFSSFMLIRALPENAGQLLHGFGVAVFWAFRKLAPTERTRERLLDDTSYEYSSRVPVHSMAVLICMVYSAVTPVLPVIGLLYMCMAYLQTKYCVTYMTTEQFQAGGLMWLQMHSHIMSALLISQIILVAMLGLKEAGQQAGVAAALPVLTIFLWVSMARRLAEPMREMALKTGRDIDALQEECQVAPITPGAYVQPALKLRGADFDEVISECRKMQAVLEVYDEGAEGRKAAKLAVLEWGVKEEGGEAL